MRGDNTSAEKSRYYKFHWDNASSVPPIGTLDYQPKRAAFRIPSQGIFQGTYLEAFPIQKIKTKLPSLGCCAYCGRTHNAEGQPLKLTSEHVIPDFLGAGLELPDASCDDCQKITSKIESSISQQMFDPVRKNLSLASKNLIMRKSNFPVDVGRETTNHLILPIADYPTILTLPQLYPASAYSSRPYGSDGLFNFLMYNINVNEIALAKYGIEGFSTQTIDTVRFCQMLAKIAHVYAVAHLGYGSFKPLVADFVRIDVPKGASYAAHFDHVGCLWGHESTSTNLHEIEIGTIQWQGKMLTAVRIRLFATYGMKSFHVAVGLPL